MRKHMRNMRVMMDLTILILFEAKANDLMSPTLHPSSLPIHFPYPSQPDEAHGSLYNCLDVKFEGCKQHKPKSDDFQKCIIKGFYKCVSDNRKHLKSKEEVEIYKIAKRASKHP